MALPSYLKKGAGKGFSKRPDWPLLASKATQSDRATK
jgi:hypothetical protein